MKIDTRIIAMSPAIPLMYRKWAPSVGGIVVGVPGMTATGSAPPLRTLAIFFDSFDA